MTKPRGSLNPRFDGAFLNFNRVLLGLGEGGR